MVGRFDGAVFDPAVMEMIYARELLPGYGWVFPESPTRVNVGVCTTAARAGRGALRARYADFLARHLGPRLRHADAVDAARGEPIGARALVPPFADARALDALLAR